MPAMDAFHSRTRVISDLGTRIGQQLIGGWLQAETQPSSAFTGDMYQRYLQECSAGYIAEQTKVAECFYVTDDMMTLTEHAAESMPNEWINREDLPAEAGFLWLPRSIGAYDVRGRELRTRAVSWHQFHGRVVLLNWTDKNDQSDEVNEYLRKMWADDPKNGYTWDTFPQLQMQHANPERYGGTMPTGPDTENLHRWRHMLGVGFLPQYGEDPEHGPRVGWTVDPETGTAENRIHAQRLLIMNPPTMHKIDPVSAFFATFCRLCQQTITIAEKEPVDRASRRRTRHLPNNESVTVINLRHSSHRKQEGESQVEWSHRWLRRGFWRRQWYGSGEDRHQVPIWINETIVNADRTDLPLIIRDHVTQLMR